MPVTQADLNRMLYEDGCKDVPRMVDGPVMETKGPEAVTTRTYLVDDSQYQIADGLNGCPTVVAVLPVPRTARSLSAPPCGGDPGCGDYKCDEHRG